MQDYLSVEKVNIQDVEAPMIGRARVMKQHRLDLLASNASLALELPYLTESPDMSRSSSIVA